VGQERGEGGKENLLGIRKSGPSTVGKGNLWGLRKRVTGEGAEVSPAKRVGTPIIQKPNLLGVCRVFSFRNSLITGPLVPVRGTC